MYSKCSAFTNNKKRCKHTFKFIIENNKYCKQHANIIYKTKANIIQKFWRSYRKRILINNIFKKLPNDLKKKVLFYVRENDLIKKHHHNVIKNILSKKFTENDIMNLEFYTGNQETINSQNYKLKNMIHILKLYIKYDSIAPYYNKFILNTYLYVLIELVESLYFIYVLDNKLITKLLYLLKEYKKLLIERKFY